MFGSILSAVLGQAISSQQAQAMQQADAVRRQAEALRSVGKAQVVAQSAGDDIIEGEFEIVEERMLPLPTRALPSPRMKADSEPSAF